VGKRRHPWLAVRDDAPPRRALFLSFLSFVLPIAIWALASYCPYVWHPKVKITDPGGVDYFELDMLVDKEQFAAENAFMREDGLAEAKGIPANPVYLPAPHEVARAFVTAFKTQPIRKGEPWLHESIAHSIRVIFYGFILSAVFGVPLGILCGTFALFKKLFEPIIDFIRYMPAPAFGPLAIAVLGIADAPKVTIIFIGTFFQMVLVVSNTTMQLDRSLLEAAQTLGAKKWDLVTRVILPGISPKLYRDMRILLGWAWTYLIVAEVVGTKTGISAFIHQQAKYYNFDNVYAAIIMIGIIGLGTDIILEQIQRMLFPWNADGKRVPKWLQAVIDALVKFFGPARPISGLPYS
jgi:NitT/TauT family transport system permease protein